ncbi:MAG: hypothetical protein ABIP06_02525 [Pyrinomonadaceae bacterium]
MTLIPIIERFSIVAPLGVCFHDAAAGARIFDGLSVFAYPANEDVRKNKTELLPNRQGVFVLQKIKGLEEFSRGGGDDEFWKNNPPEKSYILEVSDIEKRFQPFQLIVKLPVRGLYKWENIPALSPNKNQESIPLYSSPTRKTSGGMSVIRAKLHEKNGASAANAVLEARFEGKLIARGIADSDGQIVLIFPALAPQSKPLASPPLSSKRISLAEQEWKIDFTVNYKPGVFQSVPPETKSGTEEILPDLKLVLAQKKGKLWVDDGQSEQFTTAVLQTGKDLILRSRKSAVGSPPASETVFLSFLSVKPAN